MYDCHSSNLRNSTSVEFRLCITLLLENGGSFVSCLREATLLNHVFFANQVADAEHVLVCVLDQRIKGQGQASTLHV
jgi:hypothetical protein